MAVGACHRHQGCTHFTSREMRGVCHTHPHADTHRQTCGQGCTHHEAPTHRQTCGGCMSACGWVCHTPRILWEVNLSLSGRELHLRERERVTHTTHLPGRSRHLLIRKWRGRLVARGEPTHSVTHTPVTPPGTLPATADSELAGQVGDVLFEVNGNNVYCSNPEQIGNLLLGVEGSQVLPSFPAVSQSPSPLLPASLPPFFPSSRPPIIPDGGSRSQPSSLPPSPHSFIHPLIPSSLHPFRPSSRPPSFPLSFLAGLLADSLAQAKEREQRLDTLMMESSDYDADHRL